MNLVLWTFDAALCASLIWLACQTLATENLFRATVLFITFGMVMALTWARLEAPDIALAEAAIGAGLTGALLLSTLSAISGGPRAAGTTDADADAET
jgi:uncharacterized MnhB-related membrane protein